MIYQTIADFIEFNMKNFELILDLVPIPVFIKNRAGVYIDCNNAFNDFLSITRDQIIGKTVFDIWGKEEADVFYAQDEALFNAGGVQKYETGITSPEGEKYMVQFHKQVFLDSDDEIAGFLGVIFDITEKKNLENTLERLAIIDDLTNLMNRREGMKKLEIMHENSRKEKKPYCVAMIDIDNFKQINDLYGHHNGDIVLKMFADALTNRKRRHDTCFRYGGEEFVLILPDTEINDGFKVIEKIRKGWEQTEILFNGIQPVQSTISIGIAQYETEEITYGQLLQNSDKALYLAKNGGKNCSVCLHMSMN